MPIARRAKSARDTGSLGEQAYRAIRQALRDGAIRPGDRMKERELAERLALGRTPVREALKRLAVEGVLGQYTGQGLAFRTLTQREIVEIHAVWEVLQGLAAGLAAQNATAVEIAAMKALHARLARDAGRQPLLALVTARRLDRLVNDASHNAYLARQIDQLIDTVGFRTTRSTFTQPGRAAAFATEMGAVIAAIARRDPRRAEQAARRHNRQGLAARLALETAAD